jgi:ubiquinone/menaquinone biosynthesis C-methylase UbiE
LDSELNNFWGWRYENFIDYLIQKTPIQVEDDILDIATGTALIPRKIYLKHRNSKPIHGLDITPAMLMRAKQKAGASGILDRFCFVCASAMSMPYSDEAFNLITCSLGSHHMDVPVVVSEINRMLKSKGVLSIIDVGGHPMWRIPGLKLILRFAAFIYFSYKESILRAWAEADGVSNIRSMEEWYQLLLDSGFDNIAINRLDSKFFWIPRPIQILATKK